MADDAVTADASDISRAFRLGWEICMLYLSPVVEPAPNPAGDGEALPGLDRLPQADLQLLRFAQVEGGIAQLSKYFTAGHQGTPEIADLRTFLTRAGTAEQIRKALDELHPSILVGLSACDPRLASAYSLGASLAHTSNAPKTHEQLKREFDRDRLAEIGEPLADLASLLPDHSRSVRLSLSAWRRWIETPKVNPKAKEHAKDPAVGALQHAGQEVQERATPSRQLNWDHDGSEVLRYLTRQGEVWRAVLTGEKKATDMLELTDYVAAAAKVPRRMARLLRGLLIPLLLILALAIVGTWVLLNYSSTGKVVAGAAAVASAIGLTWKGIFDPAARAAERLGRPVWGAALDDVIARAITKEPPGTSFDWVEPKRAAPALGPTTPALSGSVATLPMAVTPLAEGPDQASSPPAGD